jgi:hypothetical protein
MMMRFNICDLDQDRLDTRVNEQAMEIYANVERARGRSLDDIKQDCRVGLAAEVYLIDHCGFKDDERLYKDVIDLDGHSVEVKVTSNQAYVSYVLDRLIKAKGEAYRDISDIVYLFVVNKNTWDYELEGVYHWVDIDRKWVKCESPLVKCEKPSREKGDCVMSRSISGVGRKVGRWVGRLLIVSMPT